MLARVTSYLLECDREKMTEAERAESIARDKAVTEAMRKAMSPRLLRVLLPSYNARYLDEPINYRSYLDKFEAAAPAA